MHEKHRERLRKKFLANPDLLEEHEILELLLTFPIPRKNTNEIAHELLYEFDSIAGVLNADIYALESINGIGKNSALFIKLIKTVFRMYLCNKNKNCKKKELLTLQEVHMALFTKFIGRDEENVALALFDSKNKITYCNLIEKGTVSFIDIDFRKIVSLALKHNASFAILAHNHPSGLALPSKEDVVVTKQLAETLSSLGIKLLDHIIVCEDDYVSLNNPAINKNGKNIVDSNENNEFGILKKAI